MTQERKTPDEWLKDERFGYCLAVLDPDGWDRKNYQEDWAKPLTEDEMHGKVMRSTIKFLPDWSLSVACVRVCTIGDSGGGYIQPISDPLRLDALFDGAEIGEMYTLEVISMLKKELDALPEFDGF